MSKGTIQTVKLEELVEIQPGYQSKGQMTHDPNGDLPCIQVRDLDYSSRMVKSDEIWKMKAPKDLSNYRVSSENILFLSRGSRVGAYRIEKLPTNAIPLAHFFILRPKPTMPLSIEYLWWVLNERKVANQIEGLMKGSMMPFISRTDFSQIQVPIPSRDTQALVVKFAMLRDRERRLVTELETTRSKLYEALLERKIYGE